jgi:probable DNA metabolism protein
MQTGAEGMEVTLTGQTDLAGFRAEARELLAHQVPPDAVAWILLPLPDEHFSDLAPASASRPRNVARAATAIVPASFTRLCEFVVLHRDRERFALLYRLLWRLVHEPGLRNDPVDGDMLQAQHMAHAVRRDIHKMKANIKLRPLAARGPDDGELAVAWYEPHHHVVEAAAPWFAKRIGPSWWAIFTPDRSVDCESGKLSFGPGLGMQGAPDAAAPDLWWLDCHARTFGAASRATQA